MKGLIDTTLREGAQTVGVQFEPPEIVRIVKLLCLLGIEEIEAGIACRRERALFVLMPELRKVTGSFLHKPRLSLWCRCHEDDIDVALSLKPDVLSLSIPASERHLRTKLHRDRTWVRETLYNSITLARQRGISRVSVGFEDAGRADSRFLQELVRLAEEAGAKRVRLADTVGTLSPLQIQGLVRKIRKISSLEIGIHTHNDFGMATANTLTALDSGADWADVTVLGLGERAGSARLEEVAGYLSLARNTRGYALEVLKPLCRLVAHLTGQPVSPRHPVVGDHVFACETGLHLQGLHKNPQTYEPFSPEKVGADRKLLYGSKTGRRAVSEGLSKMGIMLPDRSLEEITKVIRGLARRRKRPLVDSEIMALASQYRVAR